MRKAFSSQLRLDCLAIDELQLNLNCRDEIIPILEGLKHVFGQPELRDALIELVAADITGGKRDDTGRVGFDYWQIIRDGGCETGLQCGLRQTAGSLRKPSCLAMPAWFRRLG